MRRVGSRKAVDQRNHSPKTEYGGDHNTPLPIRRRSRSSTEQRQRTHIVTQMHDGDRVNPTIRLIPKDESESVYHRPSSLDDESESRYQREEINSATPFQSPEIAFRRSKINESLGKAVIEDQHKVEVGISIIVDIPGEDEDKYWSRGDRNQYRGEFLGQGLSKFVFGLHRIDGKYHGMVLKMVKYQLPNQAPDMEPEVFAEAQSAVPPFAPKIHYDGVGVDKDTQNRYHCWITDRTIPLHEFCKSGLGIKHRCSLAAFYCLLRAVANGLYPNDVRWCNFGIEVGTVATEHTVFIIDAGANRTKGQAPWSKKDINQKIMWKFWRECRNQDAPHEDLQRMWRLCDQYEVSASIQKCLEDARNEWNKSPTLTERNRSAAQLLQTMDVTKKFRRDNAHQQPSYKIIEFVGTIIAADKLNCTESEWFWTCYRASEALESQLTEPEVAILDQLYSRLISKDESEKDQKDVIRFWMGLSDFREEYLVKKHIWGQRFLDNRISAEERRSITKATVPAKAAQQMILDFKDQMLRWRLSETQRAYPCDKQKSILNTILHKEARCLHAATTIMQSGLPKIQPPRNSDDAAENINAVARFATDMANWQRTFAKGLTEKMQTEQHQNALWLSMRALQARKNIEWWINEWQGNKWRACEWQYWAGANKQWQDDEWSGTTWKDNSWGDDTWRHYSLLLVNATEQKERHIRHRRCFTTNTA